MEESGRAYQSPGVACNLHRYKVEGEQVKKVGCAFPTPYGQYGVPTCSDSGSKLESKVATSSYEAECIAAGG